MSTASSKPTIIVIHGAWHDPSYFTTVTTLLESAGYKVLAQQLPATGNPKPGKGIEDDIAAVRAQVIGELEAGRDVVVTGHSWGGKVAGNALYGLGKKQRGKEGKKGGVIKIAFIAAFIMHEGESIFSKLGGEGAKHEWWWVDGDQMHVSPDHDTFYNDLPPDAIKRNKAGLHTQATESFRHVTKHEAWKEIPNTFLLCEQDKAIPPEFQQLMVDAARAAGAEVEVEKLDASHSPFLSKPKETADFLRRSAGEKI